MKLPQITTHDGAIVISDTAYHRLQWCCIGAGIATKVIGLVALGFLFAGCTEDKQPNLTVADLGIPASGAYKAGASFRGQCDISYVTGRYDCYSEYPSSIDIKPLTDNTGSATYNGSINFVWLNSGGRPNYRGGAIALNVDFSNKKIRANTHIAGGFSGETVEINASYNDRGVISGSVNISGESNFIDGLIGQTRLVGVFQGGVLPRVYGGFSADRE